MKVHFSDANANWDRPLLCLTHTERPTDLERCSLNHLETRYARADRLANITPFSDLTHSGTHSPYLGSVTVWAFDHGDFRRPRLLAHLEPTTFKPQQALWHRNRLWVLGIEKLEVFDSDLRRLATVQDPWLAGGHTIAPDGRGRLLLSCSASDAVLVVDEASLEVVEALRLPESLYGSNYPLTRGDSVVDHYVPNDLQLTHVNCAWPHGDGILVSTLIQGAIGRFDAERNYQEITRGFVGCHGVRSDPRNGGLYFCDSCLGVLTFLNPTGAICRRIATGSGWLHDARHLEDDLFALAVADRNSLEIVDTASRATVHVMACDAFGKGTQFISYGM